MNRYIVSKKEDENSERMASHNVISCHITDDDAYPSFYNEESNVIYVKQDSHEKDLNTFQVQVKRLCFIKSFSSFNQTKVSLVNKVGERKSLVLVLF